MFQPDRRAFVAGAAAFASSCVAAPRERQAFVWEHKLISSNGNFPDFETDTPLNNAILAALHERRTPPTDAPSQAALAVLLEKGFAKRTQTGLVPGIAVASLSDGPRWFDVDERAIAETAALIAGRAEEVRSRVALLPSFAPSRFDDVSLLILSDVLLDNWQINAVEERWLRTQRPQRAGGRYFYAMFARAEASQLEAFGIYGNQFAGIGDAFVAVYGNRRLSAPTLQTITRGEMERRFGPSPLSEDERRAEIVARFLAVARGGDRFTEQERAGFASLGIADADGAPRIAVMTEADYVALETLASDLADPLIEILERQRPALRHRFDRSPYAESISFEEYLIWWYHFFYSAVTDRLVALGLVTPPAGGVATYIVAG